MSIEPYLEVVEEQGLPVNSGPVSSSEIERYRGRLPDGLLEFWAKYGRGAWPGGRFQLCDPALFEPVIEELFADDPNFPRERFTVIGMDTFGLLTDGSRRDLSIDVNFRCSPSANSLMGRRIPTSISALPGRCWSISATRRAGPMMMA